jgi:hypothetical protein
VMALRSYIAKPEEVRMLIAGASQMWSPITFPESFHAAPYGVSTDERGEFWFLTAGDQHFEGPVLCPFGKSGDRFYVRETWADNPEWDCGVQPLPDTPKWTYKADWPTGSPDGTHDTLEPWGKWNSPVSMPKAVSRLTREIEKIEARQLGSMTEAEARSCGIETTCPCCGGCDQHRRDYRKYWESLYGPWNPRIWAWVRTVKRVGEGE